MTCRRNQQMTEPVKAKVFAINQTSVTLLVLTGPFKDRIYGLVPRHGLVVDQFVDVVISPSGESASWIDQD